MMNVLSNITYYNHYKGVSLMRNLFKIFLLSLCVLALSSTVIFANNGSDSQEAGDVNRIQPASISDLTYLLFVWTKNSAFPTYFPQIEFKAGNILRVTGASPALGELSGIWTEVEFGDVFSYFTAQVEAEDTSTTTTSTPPTESSNQAVNSVPLQAKTSFLINLWGISFNLSFVIPPPFEGLSFGVSMLIGAGAYLGNDVFYTGFAGIDPDLPAFGSVSPNSGEQGQTISVTVTGINTTFESAATIIVDFGEGIDVGTPGVKNDTELNLDITIEANAKVGARTVSVTYDSTVISEANAFTVLEKTD
jgi:hypothetical protein